MKRLQRATVIVSLVEAMKKQGSWCGGTHVQKASFFLQELLNVPLGFQFVLYKHGPYSFELTDELTALRADSILTLTVRDPQYGPSYSPGELRDSLIERFPKTAVRYRPQVELVAKNLGSKGVVDLERLATALYVRIEHGADSPQELRATSLVKLKPHINLRSAKEAVGEVDELCAKCRRL
jgi:uncharacterized protein YwgA